MHRHRGLLAAMALAAAVALPALDGAVAAARVKSTKRKTITTTILENCGVQAPSEFCPRKPGPPATFATITVEASRVKVTYSTGPAHCSQVRLILYVDHRRAGVTAPLGPGGKGSVFIHVPADRHPHALAWRAEGFVGGCNAGILGSIGGKLTVRYTP